ncbi:hypothetical protein T4D_8480 [Trichinella pseudospiralis]|uniref:Uncharacterized protein n=1 Tax=Trichinella pseudospiralis TaxID=6337 RepID=A0A0V1FFL9_TRIPS|nr:hypothetical protein T4D_8480 [Trichinella pseudospiralis]
MSLAVLPESVLRRRSMMCRGIPSTSAAWPETTSVTVPFWCQVSHLAPGGLTHTESPTENRLMFSSGSSIAQSTPRTLTTYACTTLAGAVHWLRPPFGVTLYRSFLGKRCRCLVSTSASLQSEEAGSVGGTLVGFARQPIARQVLLHAVHGDDAFVHQDVVDVRRGSFPDIRIPGEHAVQHGFHHRWCDVQAEPQTGQAVDQGDVDALPASLAQLSATHVRVGRVALDVGVQVPEVHHGPDLLLIPLDHCHQRQQPLGRAVFALVVRHEPPVFDPLPKLVLIRATSHVRRRGQYVAVKSFSRILIPDSAATQTPGPSSPNRTHRPPVTVTPPSAAMPFMPSMRSQLSGFDQTTIISTSTGPFPRGLRCTTPVPSHPIA